MSFADVNGQHIYFDDSGGDGPAVLFSHGFLMDHEMFVHQVAALTGEFRCITWDERGLAGCGYGRCVGKKGARQASGGSGGEYVNAAASLEGKVLGGG